MSAFDVTLFVMRTELIRNGYWVFGYVKLVIYVMIEFLANQYENLLQCSSNKNSYYKPNAKCICNFSWTSRRPAWMPVLLQKTERQRLTLSLPYTCVPVIWSGIYRVSF